ncbi:MAG: glycoside hydrolase family 5 protein, partial [Planctomycetota bacterium]
DLGVVLDLHQVALEGLKNNNYSAALEDPAFVERYAVFWRALAAATAGVLDPEWLVLQPMNEPVFNDRPEDWPAVQSKVIAAIREVAPMHWIVACGARWQSRAELMKLKPLDDPRIVYDFHFYDPFEFSHQGASWVGEPVKSFAAVPYPSSPARIAPLVEAVTDQQARRRLEQYGRQEWNREKIDAEIAAVAAWAKKHEVPLMCSEFGVYSRVAPVEDRLQWYRDVVAALERHGIAWMNWNYREKYFGVAEYPEPGKPKLRTELIEALGRKP